MNLLNLNRNVVIYNKKQKYLHRKNFRKLHDKKISIEQKSKNSEKFAKSFSVERNPKSSSECDNTNGKCTKCKTGYKYTSSSGSCTACGSMTYSLGGTEDTCKSCSTSCTSCTASTGKCTTCKSGYGFDSSKGTCTECKAGYAQRFSIFSFRTLK